MKDHPENPPDPVETTGACAGGIAVIVPGYRVAWCLDACLDHLFAAGFAPEEITFVDDGSPDASVETARRRGIEPVRPGANRGAAEARNAGAAAAGGDILFFVDADVLVHADVRARVEGFFRDHPGHAGVFGSYDATPAHPGRVSRIRNLLHHHVHQTAAGDTPSFWTGCGAVRRGDFERIGGFRTADERIEDVGFGMALARAGRRVRLDPGLQCTHLKRWTLREMAWTDLRHRAIPWTRMLLAPDNAVLPHRLNTDRTGKLSVAATGLGLLGLLLAVFAPVAGLALFGAAAAALLWLNRAFLSRVARLGGWRDGAAAAGVLAVHYACAGAGYLWVRLGAFRPAA